VRFQSAPALAFELVTMLVIFVLFFCMFGVMFIGMFGTMFAGLSSAGQPGDFSWLMITLLVIRIVATISVLNGNNFRYPWLGARVESFLAD
jgi:uncharacterized Tic20 family protein